MNILQQQKIFQRILQFLTLITEANLSVPDALAYLAAEIAMSKKTKNSSECLPKIKYALQLDNIIRAEGRDREMGLGEMKKDEKI